MSEKVFFNKDIQIIRQSQIKLVYDFLIAKGVNPSVEELQRVTDVFTEFCLYGPDDDLKERVKKLDKWIDSKATKK